MNRCLKAIGDGGLACVEDESTLNVSVAVLYLADSLLEKSVPDLQTWGSCSIQKRGVRNSGFRLYFFHFRCSGMPSVGAPKDGDEQTMNRRT